MSILNLKPTHKIILNYYNELNKLDLIDRKSEGAVSPVFAALLRYCARQYDWTLAEQFIMKPRGKLIKVDGAVIDDFKIVHGLWEAKDSDDDLETEVKKKFQAGYPKEKVSFRIC